MNGHCTLGYDADVVMTAAVEKDEEILAHAAECARCAAYLRVRNVVKAGWADALAESEAVARRRDQRAEWRFARASTPRSRIAPLVLAFAAGAAIALGIWVGTQRTQPLADVTPAATSAAEPAPPAPSASAPRPPAVVVRDACAACKATNATEVAADTSLETMGEIDVPAKSRLVLAFSFDGEPGATIAIDGPGHAVADGRNVRVARGRTTLLTPGRGTVTTSFGALDCARGAWVVEVGESGVVVVSGKVDAIGPSGARVSLSPRDDLAPRTPAITATASAPPPIGPDERWAAVRRALDAGDRGRAEAEVRDLLRVIGDDHPLHDRASFALAELELARGAVAQARPRLEALTRSRDARLAEDAKTLLATTESRDP